MPARAAPCGSTLPRFASPVPPLIYPAQFGHLAARLAGGGHHCVFVTRAAATAGPGVRVARYDVKGGATRQNHYCSRTFENCVWQAHAVYEACKPLGLAPGLVVGHSGFGSTVFLPELWRAPIVNYFEYYYHPHGSDMDDRPDFPPSRRGCAATRRSTGTTVYQLFGRCGRQGDPGSYEGILSLEDDLVRSHLGRLASPAVAVLAAAPGLLARRGAALAVAWAQRTAERRHSTMRRDLLRYDEHLDSTLAFSGHRE